MNMSTELSGVTTPLVEMPWFMAAIALAAGVFSVYWFATVNVDCWGSNRVLYHLSRGRKKIGQLLALIPSVVSVGVAVYFGGRAFGIF